MASGSFITRSLLLLLFIAVFLTASLHAQAHVHEDGTVHDHSDGESNQIQSEPSTGAIVPSNANGALDNHIHEEGEASHSHSHGISCDMEPIEDYNLPLRIGSVFIVLVTSAVGIFSPIILYRISPYKEGSARDWALTAGKFFGTGVIIATAFIHMLPEALEHFDSECIGEGWHTYHAFGGLFCMIASFFLQIIELAAISNLDAIAQRNAAAAGGHTSSNTIKNGNSEEYADSRVNEKSIVDPSNDINHIERSHHEHNHTGINEDGHVHSAGFLENEQSIRNIGTFILEFGIVVHSIIIGITLGCTDSSSFQTLLIALVFHQFFEGIALGTRINDLQSKTWTKPILMGLLFICMTPIGVGIGIGVRSTINPPAAILAQAILDSLSAGILLYNAYVSLMSIEINHNVGFRKSSLGRKAFCFLCMYLGAALMSVLGAWA
ncbi:ZIP zinc transporter-domain-containing protein [Parasitella parasitica]|nr:ZIP zinc transporter-domain-containing protein [Parasitella parasitica]